MSTILTLDLGTTYFKAALFSEHGELLVLTRQRPPIKHRHEGWCELDPAEFLRTVYRAVAELARVRPGGLRDVVALSFATQTNSFLLLDKYDAPLTPIVLWPDGRAADSDRGWRDLGATPDFQEITGVPALTQEFMIAKLLWLQAHDPRRCSRARRLCLLSDYLTLRLTGRHVTEAGAAGLTGLIDIHRLEWWPAITQRVHVDTLKLPRIERAGADLGPLLPEAANELGLPQSCRFVVGCLDQYAGAIGTGNVLPGRLTETTGTVLATVRCGDKFVPRPGANIIHGPGFAPGIYYQMVFGNTSANLLEWLRESLPDRPDFAALDRLAANVPPGSEGLQASAPPSGQCRAIFIGRTERHTTAHAARAVLEAVAFALADQVEHLCGQDHPTLIRSSGGAARSNLWLQIKANVLETPFAATLCPEPTSLGAALLAIHALTGRPLRDLAADIRLGAPVTPNAEGPIYRTIRPCTRV